MSLHRVKTYYVAAGLTYSVTNSYPTKNYIRHLIHLNPKILFK